MNGVRPVHMQFTPIDLIERFWKFAKGKLRTKYYDDFALFQHTIDSIVNSADKDCKQSIDKLIGDKVQLFDDIIPPSPMAHHIVFPDSDVA